MPDLPPFVRLSATRGFAPAYLRYWYDLPYEHILKVYFGDACPSGAHEAGIPEVYTGIERKRFLHWLKAHSMLVELPCETPPAPPDDALEPLVHDLTREEAAAYFDQEAQRVLGMRGPDFVAAWEGGQFDADPDRSDVMYMAMLLPFVQ